MAYSLSLNEVKRQGNGTVRLVARRRPVLRNKQCSHDEELRNKVTQQSLSHSEQQTHGRMICANTVLGLRNEYSMRLYSMALNWENINDMPYNY